MSRTLKQKLTFSFIGNDASAQVRQDPARTVVYDDYLEGGFVIHAEDTGEFDIPIPDGLNIITCLQVVNESQTETILYELNFNDDVELGPGCSFVHMSSPTNDEPLYGCAIYADNTPASDIRVSFRVFGVA